jgi:lipid A 3-O-deacylase
MRPTASVQVVSLALGLALTGVPGITAAVDRVAVEAGAGNHVDVFGVSIGWPDWKRGPLEGDWSLSAYGKGTVASWEGRDHETPNKYVTAFGAYPVLRLETSSGERFWPFLEGSVGVNLLSRTRINNEREFSTAFQFSEFLGAGVAFGDKREYDLGLRVQHVSNGNIKFPNDGLTYGSVVFQYRFAEP